MVFVLKTHQEIVKNSNKATKYRSEEGCGRFQRLKSKLVRDVSGDPTITANTLVNDLDMSGSGVSENTITILHRNGW